jgi:hypothetical protein
MGIVGKWFCPICGTENTSNSDQDPVECGYCGSGVSLGLYDDGRWTVHLIAGRDNPIARGAQGAISRNSTAQQAS